MVQDGFLAYAWDYEDRQVWLTARAPMVRSLGTSKLVDRIEARGYRRRLPKPR